MRNGKTKGTNDMLNSDNITLYVIDFCEIVSGALFFFFLSSFQMFHCKISFSTLQSVLFFFLLEKRFWKHLPWLRMCCRHSFSLHEVEATSVLSYDSMKCKSASQT